LFLKHLEIFQETSDLTKQGRIKDIFLTFLFGIGYRSRYETLLFNFLPELFLAHMAGFLLVKDVQLIIYSTPV
jgi:hypothetical protein